MHCVGSPLTMLVPRRARRSPLHSSSVVYLYVACCRASLHHCCLLSLSFFLLCGAALIKGKSIKPVMGHRQNIKWLIPRGVFGKTLIALQRWLHVQSGDS